MDWTNISSNRFNKCKKLQLIKQKKILKWWKNKRVKLRTRRLIAIKQVIDKNYKEIKI